MSHATLNMLRAEIANAQVMRPLARVSEVGRGLLRITGTGRAWRLGDRVSIIGADAVFGGEIVVLDSAGAGVLSDEMP